MQPTDRIRCEYRLYSNSGLTGFPLIVPDELWDDFRRFLLDAGIEAGPTDSQVAADGTVERLQFFQNRNSAEVEQLRIVYLADYRARFLN